MAAMTPGWSDGELLLTALCVMIGGDGDGDDDCTGINSIAVTTMLDEERNARVTPRASANSGCDARAADKAPDEDAAETADDTLFAIVSAVEPSNATSAAAAAILKKTL